jgi:hypothetical protein
MKIIQHSHQKKKKTWEAPPIQSIQRWIYTHTPHVANGKKL